MNLNKKEIDLLVTNLKEGNQSAVSDLYNRYSHSLYGVILKIVRDDALAQDVLQDTFVTVWKKVNTYDDSKGSFFTWILNVARNKAIDNYRKSNRVSDGQERYENELKSTSYLTEFNTSTIGVKDMVDKIPEDRQDVLRLLYFEGYTQKETAEELDIPLGTVKTRVRLALKDLKKLFSIIFWI